ncbi:hypothetical protein RND81_03G060300 [Saponaria officinalis]|uniref:ATP-dependent DNA helicase n=1 Tax=Saponaria officinalis TaxID=3572 RepID=A0AAW1M5Y3_SAPOF
MRAIHDPGFSDFALKVGNGSSSFVNGKDIMLPRHILISAYQNCSLIDKLINSVYPDTSLINLDPFLTTKRAILTPKNEDADFINHMLKNSPIILLRNLDPTFGLCNGTRLICRTFSRNVIEAEIVIGHHKGERVFIPRIPLRPSPSDKYPFNFRRKQFPIKLSFAMTVNKAQGQTLDKVGIYLPQPIFSHGQLYVALSRAKKSADVTVAINPNDSNTDGFHRTPMTKKQILYLSTLCCNIHYYNKPHTLKNSLHLKNPSCSWRALFLYGRSCASRSHFRT